ncbi:MAG: [FeFe] hydrogenase H-cluster maturation GTPase HydF [Salinivirgaceae bacterium]|jgi:[FeFe] hydrogenase H-cluster maturation GTPase HydF|nr:[FeFe] hydrogenase H-cluster maturation GTPase HydF [Salinivirgaceae bacterium]
MQKGKTNTPHIGIYGRRNNGKSTLINELAGQEIAIVSDFAGTTTDPVKKSFEITGFGPVVLIDTAGIDDTGELGQKRVAKSKASIKTIDLGLIIITNNTFDTYEEDLINAFQKTSTPFFIIHNKSDLVALNPDFAQTLMQKYNCKVIEHSTVKNNTEPIIATIKSTIPESAFATPSLVGDLISYGDIVLLITPIDIEAPEGRLILPQVQAIRDILDNDAICIVLKEREVDAFLRKTKIEPALAITDSQIFTKADASIPRHIPLTSFSIVLARYKGDFDAYLNGTPRIDQLADGDRILLLESCTHHVACDDIGRVKIPRWISAFTGKKHEYDVVSGLNELPRPITDYSLVIQCGGCMITRKQLINRIRPAIEAGIPVTNYGMAIAYVQGIYQRAIAPFTSFEENATDYL